MKYTIIIEQGPTNFGAYVPDLPGCIAVADSLDELKVQIKEAIDFHIDGLREEGLPVPMPTSSADEVEVDLHAA